MKNLWRRLFGKSNATSSGSKAARKRGTRKDEIHFASELETLTNQVIREAVGSDGILTNEFNKRIAMYDPEVNPIGEEAAKELLVSMLSMAVAQRKVINGRIEKSVEVGNLFDRYYGKLNTINVLSNQANVKRKAMLDAQERYQDLYGRWKVLRDKAYTVKPDPNYAPEEDQQELFEALHKAGGKT